MRIKKSGIIFPAVPNLRAAGDGANRFHFSLTLVSGPKIF
jgi:hypothetical protein